MENSAASYLHKKFKKQLSIDPSKQHHHQNESKGVVDTRQEKTPEPNQTCKDNNESVPNQSTNQSSSLSKSSISVEQCCSVILQSSNSCISKTWTEPVSTSSILDNLYKVKPEDVASKDHEEAEKTPDKSSAGKYVCPYCNLVCSKPSVLQKHIRAHTNERPFPCNSCGFSFKTRSNLYKHCRSRTHANRVMGNKAQEMGEADEGPKSPQCSDGTIEDRAQDLKTKPYKPRFHTKHIFKENEENKDEPKHNSNILSDHINEIINKNNSIVNSHDPYLLKKRPEVEDHHQRHITDLIYLNNNDEPLNLTKNRKRCMSEVVEPGTQKSLIKELLLKNLNSDMQCPHCKMIFQTVTELELHKLRSCKGFVKPGAKYSRSSSVNVASILTQNKNAFDNIPHLQNAVFPLKSPGPFLGKTRLVESDKNKSFSFDDGLPTAFPPSTPTERYLLSPLTLPSEREKKTPVKLFGGEVKITHTSGETKSFKIDNKDDKFDSGFVEYSGKVSENRVVKSGLQSGGTVLTNKANYPKEDSLRTNPDVIRVYDNTPASPNIGVNLTKPQITYRGSTDPIIEYAVPPYSKYTNIVDFSQKAVKLLTPNLKQPNLAVPGVPTPNHFTFPSFTEEKIIDLEKPEPQQKVFQPKIITPQPVCNPVKLLVNGKVVRHVPGIPGPVVPEDQPPPRLKPEPKPLEVKIDHPADKSPVKITETKKFARPNSLALKPTTASLKQHHGLTPTLFNQILISPDTPRVAKKYVHQFLHGNYFSYLGLKCSTRTVYCTLNKTQPFYVQHFKKLSMYSEWRQQDTKTEKLYVSAYDSRQRHQRYTTAGKTTADLVHSSYKFVVSESSSGGDKSEEAHKSATILGGYECNEDYTYIRGRGRGRYVCDQCGIRCKKPSMLKKHIRTHSNDRPYTCNHCNFSFKTKGNLTKHMKSKAHTKNYAASGSGSSTQQSGTQSSESDTEDSGMDSSDESTRREEHEAAYGLLSLSQKTSQSLRRESTSPMSTSGSDPQVLNTEEIAHASKTNYAKNKFLDDKTPLNFSVPKVTTTTISSTTTSSDEEVQNLTQFLGKTTINRPLTYPYTSILPPECTSQEVAENPETKSIKQFHVIQKYASRESPTVDSSANCLTSSKSAKDRTRVPSDHKVNNVPVLKVNDAVVLGDSVTDLRKRKLSYAESEFERVKQHKTDEVMDLSMPVEKNPELRYNGSPQPYHHNLIKKNEDLYPSSKFVDEKLPVKNNGFVSVNINYVIPDSQPINCESPKIVYKTVDYDNSAMETLADIATKQVKLEKNTLAKSVATEFLKIATKNEFPSGDATREANTFGPVTKEVNDLIVKPEGNKSCHICAKSFSKTPQLRLHMNIHYLERPFRCHSCSVSFRTKGHLQKHERSASHHNKLSSSPALSSSEPRPFKCVDCNIAFRIHGHLAKHLRSKMHIMKLECLAKIPFGLYAELERSNSLLTEINTADGDQCLESLKTLAKKVFINDPNKLNQLNSAESIDADS
ncbi:uncharacterized protein LOC660305 [Tribolium castaneum]|uniref:Schnurri n=1 Tax=Tribolium castaneum TaxID=7070 RepID=D6WSD0_TRICA|nr:PREDICTED: uncharacterized protein LOC660305 [Tribolium castaneum]XP_008195310.1 PREDICTED: uncharacterized protein LOC660305 [Tribolium castaneum]XP_008195311.1 PREDICTED: uncharacterized protein LOC660305 [Tribolium castaneum]XP_971641.1 PREDICTED: uncharacterized protein LOC660305 [Tribolium castaneum]EFA07497.2 schnurri [Tribolium castaneum]|eukprot:XP_008195309.1 PREDICTED: uncharacterized protein LOC660305 [Tribolium castaneum]